MAISEENKPTSEKKIAANRRNAMHSTGPRTRDGKQRASMNSLRHGMLARAITPFIEEDHYPEYVQLLDGLQRRWKPEDFEEELEVQNLANCFWRLRKCDIYERTSAERHYKDERPDGAYSVFEYYRELRESGEQIPGLREVDQPSLGPDKEARLASIYRSRTHYEIRQIRAELRRLKNDRRLGIIAEHDDGPATEASAAENPVAEEPAPTAEPEHAAVEVSSADAQEHASRETSLMVNEDLFVATPEEAYQSRIGDPWRTSPEDFLISEEEAKHEVAEVQARLRNHPDYQTNPTADAYKEGIKPSHDAAEVGDRGYAVEHRLRKPPSPTR